MPVSTECAAALLSFRYPSKILQERYLDLLLDTCTLEVENYKNINAVEYKHMAIV